MKDRHDVPPPTPQGQGLEERTVEGGEVTEENDVPARGQLGGDGGATGVGQNDSIAEKLEEDRDGGVEEVEGGELKEL